MTVDMELVQNDNKPDLLFTITNRKTGAAIPLAGHTINFYFTRKNKTTLINSGHTACSEVQPANGICKYVWDNHDPASPEDLANPGEFEGEVEITYSTGKVETYPEDRKFTFDVREEIA